LTDHENAAYSNFINLLARTILKKNLNLYIPISKVDENMQNCQKRNAVLGEKFWFRKNIHPEGADLFDTVEEEYEKMTIKEIMNGKGMMPGICTIIDEYLDMEEIAESTRNVLKAHVDLVRQRSTGERKTGATWIREFVMKHPLYKQDSVVSSEINYDLCQRIIRLDSNDLLA
jgi:glutamate--cysteine ligase catalytic subunit